MPFKGSLEGDVTVTPLAPPFLQVDVEATGNATHLGQFTLDIPHVVNPANRTAVGTYEFTAANGDKVYAEFTGTATPTATPGVLYIEETATITGGTGRFAGATGSFTASACTTRSPARPSVPSRGPSPAHDPRTKSGRWGPYRQASPPPARHRPALGLRAGWALVILPQTPEGDDHDRFSFRPQVEQLDGRCLPIASPAAPVGGAARPVAVGSPPAARAAGAPEQHPVPIRLSTHITSDGYRRPEPLGCRGAPGPLDRRGEPSATSSSTRTRAGRHPRDPRSSPRTATSCSPPSPVGGTSRRGWGEVTVTFTGGTGRFAAAPPADASEGSA